MTRLIRQLSPPLLINIARQILRRRDMHEAIIKSLINQSESVLSLEINGYKIDIPKGAGAESVYPIYFKNEQLRFNAVTEKPMIIDCGSHIGLSVLYFKLLYPTADIIAVEADPKNFEFLKRNVEQFSRVKPLHRAVSIHSGNVEFSQRGGVSGRLSAADQIESSSKGPTCNVEAISLRELIGNKSIDLLKVDIEGSEVEVLLDAESLLCSVRRLFVEYHSFASQPQKLDDLVALLRRSGYRIYIDSEPLSAHPFTDLVVSHGMDMRLNIFAWRP